MCLGMANGGKQVANDGKTMLQRAIESAKNRVYYIDVNSMGDISYHHHKKAENQKELMNITVDALEKQIPEKVEIEVFEDIDEDTGKPYTMMFKKCSACGEHIGLKSHRFCAYCGQALDWSGTK